MLFAAAPEFNRRRYDEDVSLTVDGEAELAYWVSSSGRHLFIVEYRLGDGMTTKQVALLTPEALEFSQAILDGASLWVTGASGALIELSTQSWNILRWRGSKGLVGDGEVVEHVLRAPSTRFLWLSVRARLTRGEIVRVVDIERSRVHRVGLFPE